MTLAPQVKWGALGIFAFLAAWYIASLLADEITLPSPAATAGALVDLIIDASALEDLILSLGRVLVGFVAGAVAGLLLGCALASHAAVRAALEPYVTFLRSITPIAWVGPATLWLGTGQQSILFIVLYATLIPVTINTLAGMLAVGRDAIRMAQVFGVNRWQATYLVQLPSAIPNILTGVRLALGYAVMTVVGAEMIVGSDGLGYRIYAARLAYDTATMFAGLALLGVIGLVADRAISSLRSAYLRRHALEESS